MFNKKKAQQALEFMLILVFVMVIISVAIYVSGKFIVDIKEKENSNQIQNFIENIEKEVEILNRAQGGYYRELKISTKDYHVNISSKILIIKDLNNENKTQTYELSGNDTIYLKEDIIDGEKITSIVFEKYKK